MFQFHSVVAITLLILISNLVIIYGNDINDELKDTYINDDLPHKSDLVIYLKSLRRILYFCSKHKYDLDMNFVFGLFLTNVNLKKVLYTKRRQIPEIVHNYIILLLKENDDLIGFFNKMVKVNHEPKEKLNKMITTLFSNETQWIKQLQDFDTTPLEDSDVLDRQLEDMSSSWYKYMKSVDDMDQWVPQPRLSDMCMVSLASNEIHDSIYSRCQIYEPCYFMLKNGTNFGYALSHRLLFLLHARHSRGCAIFSKEKDNVLVREFCTTAFNEARFIVMNDYQIVDLILEQMCLCALDGHSQFLQRKWLSNILRFQTPYGCFGQRPSVITAGTTTLSRHPRSWKLAKHRDHRIMDGLCNGHVTSVAAATLAAAIRYILEMFY